MTICRSCKQPVVRALDDERCGIPVVCDPGPVSPVGELLALTQGRSTYGATVARTASRSGVRVVRYLIERSPSAIRGFTGRPILAEHRCGATPLPIADAKTSGWGNPSF